MSAVDGSFDEETETVQASISGLDEDDYVVEVRCEDSGNVNGTLDSVFVQVRDGDLTPPVCSVDSLRNNTVTLFLPNSMNYFNQLYSGLYIYGSSNDSESDIDNVQYNRTSPNNNWNFQNANPDDGSFDELLEEWYSDQYNTPEFVEGNHTICCRATEDSGNIFVGGCKDICFDTDEPTVSSLVDNTQDCDSEGNYWNDDSITWSWSGEDEGCAGIAYYEVKLMQVGNSTPIVTQNVSVEEWSNDNASVVLLDGNSYYIYVTPIDNAGNIGETK
jgi:hypothetical protein